MINRKKLEQLFCNHDYMIPTEYDDEKERDRLVANLGDGESIAFVRLHRCTKCGKEKMIGSGLIF